MSKIVDYLKNIRYNLNRVITEPILLMSDIHDCSKNYCISIDPNGQYIKQYYTVSKTGVWEKSETAPYMPIIKDNLLSDGVFKNGENNK